MNQYVFLSILSIVVPLYGMQEQESEHPASPGILRNAPALKEKRKGGKVDLEQAVTEVTNLIIAINGVNGQLHEKMATFDVQMKLQGEALKAMQARLDSLSNDIEEIQNHKIIDLSKCDPKKLLQENSKPIVVSLAIIVAARLLGF